jgi:hypothetical protein
MRFISYAMILALVASFSLLVGCGGGSGVDPTPEDELVTTLTGTAAEVEALTRAWEDATLALEIALNPENDSYLRIKALHIYLLLSGVGKKTYLELQVDVDTAVRQVLEPIARDSAQDPVVRTAALDLVHVGKTMIDPLRVPNPALFVGYTPIYMQNSEGLVPVPELTISEKLAPDECLTIVEKIRGIQAGKRLITDSAGRIWARSLWGPVEIIKSLSWCRPGVEPPTLVPDNPDKPEDDYIHVIKQGQLGAMLELFTGWQTPQG